MYWVKLLVWTLLSIPFAIAFESASVKWLPSWVPIGCTLSESMLSIMLLACAGRFADGVSTVIALKAPFLAESAPSLGPSPDIKTLSILVIIQIGIVVAGTLLVTQWINANEHLLRIVLLVIALVSFSASISNTILWIASASPFVSNVHHRLLDQEEEARIGEKKIHMEQNLLLLKGVLELIRQEKLEKAQRAVTDTIARMEGNDLIGTLPERFLLDKVLREIKKKPEEAKRAVMGEIDSLQKQLNYMFHKEELRYILNRESSRPLLPIELEFAHDWLTLGKILANILAVPGAIMLVALFSLYVRIGSDAPEIVITAVLFAVWYNLVFRRSI